MCSKLLSNFHHVFEQMSIFPIWVKTASKCVQSITVRPSKIDAWPYYCSRCRWLTTFACATKVSLNSRVTSSCCKNADQHSNGVTLCPADSTIFSCWNPLRSLQMGRQNCFSGWIPRGFLESEQVGIQHRILRWVYKRNFDWRPRPAW